MTTLQRDIRDLANIADVTAVAAIAFGRRRARGWIAELRRSFSNRGFAADNAEALFRPARSYVLGAIAPSVVRNIGKRVIQNPESLYQRFRIARVFARSDG